MEPHNGKEEAFRNELFRLNCVEIASEAIANKYEDYPIRLVDNVLSSDEEEEYVDYVCFGRNGMPNWKAYYDIKNLVETLEDVGGLENEDVGDVLQVIEESFLMILFSKIGIENNVISNPFRLEIFNILRKLEFFYPKDEDLLKFILKVDIASISMKDALDALREYNNMLQDENYFLDEEKLLISVIIYYFFPEKKALLDKNLDKLGEERSTTKLISFLSRVKVQT